MQLTSLSTSSCPETGYWLLHEGARALAEVEARGIRIDMDRLQSSKDECAKRVQTLERAIHADPIAVEWRRRFGSKTNYSAPAQLGEILFGHLGIEGGSKTKTGKWSTKDEDLQKIDHPFVRMCSEAGRLRKLQNTFLSGIGREVIDGLLHASYSLNIARTYRSSSSDPNFQNFPVRDLDSARIIRECFIPREGRMLIEIDYAAIEVKVAACYHKDPTMISYIEDATKDMHRDMAAQIYKLDPEQVGKAVRHCAKNQFVFPQFYGDYYVSCAKAMWESITKFKLETSEGVPLIKHLRSKGIRSMGLCNSDERPVKGTFEHWMKCVEDDFWNVRFPVYTSWKKRWYAKYQREGYFDTLTGFRVNNYHDRKDVINYPVQGAAFHCLLWSLIKMQDAIKKYRMKTHIVGQIHDSILADVPVKEVRAFLRMAHEIMVARLTSTWKWLIVPMAIEAEGSEVNWYQKKGLKIDE